ADPDRGGVRRTHGHRTAFAPLHSRRLARAAHTPDLDPRLRGDPPPGRRDLTARLRAGPPPDRGGGRAHVGAGQRLAAPGPARPGGGLGLSIVAAVVDAHQGSVRVTETPGGGATFTVELPLTENPEVSPRPAPGDQESLAS